MATNERDRLSSSGAPESRAAARARREAEEQEKREWIARRMREDEEREAEEKRQARAAAAARKQKEKEEEERLRRREQEQREQERKERKEAAAARWAGIARAAKIAALVLMALIVLLGAGGAFLGFKISNSPKNLPNVSLNGIPVGGLTREETAKKLDDQDWAAVGEPLTVQLPMDITVELDRQEAGLGLAMDAQAAAELAYAYGHGDNVVDDVLKYAGARVKPVALTVEPGELDEGYVRSKAEEAVAAFRKKTAGDSYTIDEEKKVLHFIKGAGQMDIDQDALYDAMLRALQAGETSLQYDTVISQVEMPDFQKLYDELNVEPQNATFINKDFEIEPEVIGCTFDPKEAQELWEKAQVMEELLIPLEILEPEVKAEDLEGMLFRDLLGSQTSSYAGSSRSRINNINLAVSKINGLVLMPGETFSYNSTVGQRTLAAGFEEAAAYSNGEVVQEVGGGICQVSSTLYCATLYARMQIVSRTNHYFRVNYLPLGQDATVSWPEPDFQFRNDRDYPVKIVASCDNNALELKIEIWGTDVDGIYVTLSYEQYAVMHEKYTDICIGWNVYLSIHYYDAEDNFLYTRSGPDSTYFKHDYELDLPEEDEDTGESGGGGTAVVIEDPDTGGGETGGGDTGGGDTGGGDTGGGDTGGGETGGGDDGGEAGVVIIDEDAP